MDLGSLWIVIRRQRKKDCEMQKTESVLQRTEGSMENGNDVSAPDPRNPKPTVELRSPDCIPGNNGRFLGTILKRGVTAMLRWHSA
jgi:hypothetical protein